MSSSALGKPSLRYSSIKFLGAIPYNKTTITQQRKAKARIIQILENPITNYTGTTILPPKKLLSIWEDQFQCDNPLLDLVIWEAFDGGSNFRFEEKVRNSQESPCKLIDPDP